MSLKYLVVGRCGSGKDTLVDRLCSKHGYTRVVSHTTRPIRKEDEDTHIFVTPKEAEQIEDKIAVTSFAGYDYFTTPGEIEKHDFYIVDPPGVYDIANAMPDTVFHIIFVTADEELRKQAFFAREDNKDAEEEWNRRIDMTKEMFDEFERTLTNSETKNWPPNLTAYMTYVNDFTGEHLEETVDVIASQIRKYKNMKRVVETLIEKEKLVSDENGNPLVSYEDTNATSVPVSIFTDMALHNDKYFIAVMLAYLDITHIIP